jgi:pimeloyl-ACP methyl ester carboxylesterase
MHSAEPTLAFTHVHVVDVASGSVLPDQTVVIAGNRIAAVGPAAGVHVPVGAQVVEAKALYLIPGLWDMHVHSWEEAFMRDVFLPLYVAHGVTGIRELGGQPFNLEQRAAITAGTLLGPRMVVGSPFADGPNPTFPERSVRVANAGEAHRAVDSLLAEGYDFVKTYKFLSPAAYRALHERGREVGMEISGEIPISVSLWEAADLGHRTVEHLSGVEIACSGREEDLRIEYRNRAEEISADTTLRTHLPVWIRTEWEPIASVDLEKCATLYRHLAAHGTWVVPTLMIQRLISFHADPDLQDHPGQKYLPAGVWDPDADADFFDPERQLRPTYEHRLRTLPDLHRAGVGILAGTDVPAGFTLHDELALYVESGLTPLEALRTATLNPARYLGRTDDLGTVAPGRLADLVLLDANPLEDIRNTQRIRAVVLDGRYFDRLALDEVLAGVELAARESVVHVAPPTGKTEADRASILAALGQVRPGGTVQFGSGRYLVGPIIRIDTPGITLLGHAEGTVLRGCELDDYEAMERAFIEAFQLHGFEVDHTILQRCGQLHLTGGNVTVRAITFEQSRMGVVLGCCENDQVLRSFAGGYVIEGNTFRNTGNSIRAWLQSEEPTVIRGNEFINTYHALSAMASRIHFVDNRVSVPEPALVPFETHPGFGITIGAYPVSTEGGEAPPLEPCIENVISGNHVEGHPDALVLFAGPGMTCRDNEVRENTLISTRVPRPEVWRFEAIWPINDPDDPTFVGLPLRLWGAAAAEIPPELAGEGLEPGGLLGTRVYANEIRGADGLGLQLTNASGNQIVENTVSQIRVRDPFPGNDSGSPGGWEAVNGSGIWVSPGSDENEILGNTFEDVASYAVVLEGDRNRVETRSASDAVRDLGSDNEVRLPPAESRFANADGVRLHYLDFGGEGLPVILVHAIGRDATHFQHIGPLLAGEYRLLAPDRRGNGESEDTGGGYDTRTQALDILHFMDVLGIERAVLASNVADEIVFLAEHHPNRLAGVIHLGGPPRGVTARGDDPTGTLAMLGRYVAMWGVPIEAYDYRPRYLRSEEVTMPVPALLLERSSGMRGVETWNLALMLVGSPHAAETIASLPPQHGRAHYERLLSDVAFRQAQLAQIPDPEVRTFFERLAADEDLQAQVQRFHEESGIPAEIAHWEAFRRGMGENLRSMQLDLPLLTGYEYHDAPELIVPHIRDFLDDVSARERSRSESPPAGRAGPSNQK